MIIELKNIHVKQTLLVEVTCMLPANENIAMWIQILLRMCSQVTNKAKGTNVRWQRSCVFTALTACNLIRVAIS
jgi:hypothetical protein